MKQVLFIISILMTFAQCRAQPIPTKEEIVGHFGFEEKSITINDEEIVFYTYQKGESPKTKIVMFLQGSDPGPQFGYYTKDGETKYQFWHWGEHSELDEEYIYVIVEKIGFEKPIAANAIPKPFIYDQKNSLDNRVFRANEVINYMTQKDNFEKIIVYGHSEGAPVAAKLGIVNKQITHLGFWCGNALPDFYDFILMARKQYLKGEISVEKAQEYIDDNIKSFRDIAADTANVEDGGYTNRRWWSYAEPPINHLLKIDIPLYVQVSTNDESAPIESTYLIPLEFARLGKTNLTYKVCVGCDHGFFVQLEDGTKEHKWYEIFRDFIDWSNANDQ